MFKRLTGLALAVYVIVMFAAITPIHAQDSTNEPTPTAEGTAVVIVPPATPAPVETALPPENPRGNFQISDWLPYIVPVVIISVLAFFALMGGVVIALWKNVPAALKPIAYPMIESGGGALLDMADNYAKTTASKADDDLVAELRAEVNAKLKALYDEMQAQRAADLIGNMNHVG